MEPKALRIEGLHVHYGSSHVIQGAALELDYGEVYGLIGRNGVGKTTLISALMGFVTPSNGLVLVDGTEVGTLRVGDRCKLGLALVPQGRRLFRSLTVEEHLRLADKTSDTSFPVDRIFTLFPSLNLRRRSRAISLSGGEQSMLAIARALTLNPKILLLDEPTEGLAPMLVDALGYVLMELRDTGIAVLLVEQNLKFALSVADRLGIMQRGTMVGEWKRMEIDDVTQLSRMIIEGVKNEHLVGDC